MWSGKIGIYIFYPDFLDIQSWETKKIYSFQLHCVIKRFWEKKKNKYRSGTIVRVPHPDPISGIIFLLFCIVILPVANLNSQKKIRNSDTTGIAMLSVRN